MEKNVFASTLIDALSVIRDSAKTLSTIRLEADVMLDRIERHTARIEVQLKELKALQASAKSEETKIGSLGEVVHENE